jgi:hypothetical protein
LATEILHDNTRAEQAKQALAQQGYTF